MNRKVGRVCPQRAVRNRLTGFGALGQTRPTKCLGSWFRSASCGLWILSTNRSSVGAPVLVLVLRPRPRIRPCAERSSTRTRDEDELPWQVHGPNARPRLRLPMNRKVRVRPQRAVRNRLTSFGALGTDAPYPMPRFMVPIHAQKRVLAFHERCLVECARPRAQRRFA